MPSGSAIKREKTSIEAFFKIILDNKENILRKLFNHDEKKFIELVTKIYQEKYPHKIKSNVKNSETEQIKTTNPG